jgi:ribose 5-phosphate isomerase B
MVNDHARHPRGDRGPGTEGASVSFFDQSYTWSVPPTPAGSYEAVKIAIGSDHAGFELKAHFLGFLGADGHDLIDLGTHSTEPVDYPPICAAVAREVATGRAGRGIVLGGSGQGEQITANKVRGVRAALCNDLYTARYSRLHNDANVLSMGARVIGTGLAEEIVRTWFATEFEGGRHVARLEEINKIEHEEHEA